MGTGCQPCAASEAYCTSLTQIPAMAPQYPHLNFLPVPAGFLFHALQRILHDITRFQILVIVITVVIGPRAPTVFKNITKCFPCIILFNPYRNHLALLQV